MGECTDERRCGPCAAGMAIADSRKRETREATPGPSPKPRRWLFWEGMVCPVSLLPRAYCAGCEAGNH
jgi:hypothetical protein